ncbi:ABC transporter substrate-binding protein [Cronbergia sp. UHCC 0137]|uniref:ABC transporter substrate-binding protein n=1 Tax=Cronbergia sp. UHCC 0137 TaxID=3110239 RepID=UPI002B217F69|nr:ABC transporter substrate-binding protein [Cronbergia sp. UHCC 0137]MEA5617118.1 ABC transporter substrate-binding protein [Cronbergia sp. UHCC 0137]
MYKIRRGLRLFGLTLLAIVLFSACVNNVSQNLTSSNELLPSQCRIVKHLMGETCVPNDPQRIVVLDEPSLEIALTLGLKPVGTSVFFGDVSAGNIPAYLRKKVQEVAMVGESGKPNLEKILTLKPDVILSVSNFTQKGSLYNQLSQIAPTVTCEWWNGKIVRWQECFKYFAETLGKSSEADIVVNDYQQRVTKLQQRLGNSLNTTEVSLVRIYADRIRLRGEGQGISSMIIQDVGLPRSPIQKEGIDMSMESIKYADGDVMFLQRHPQADKYQYILNHPLWLQLNAVKSGKVYEVGDDYWHGGSYIAANLILDDLFKYLVK